jgi:hypothetical protein
MDSLKFHLCPPCPTLLHPAGGPLPKWPYSRFWGGLPTGRVACNYLLPPWIPHAIRACWFLSQYGIQRLIPPAILRDDSSQSRMAWGIQGVEDGLKLPALRIGHP